KGKELKAKIYLPPKFTMASVYRSRGRDIASEKNLCVPVSRAYVKAIYGTASNKYITLIDQMLARKYEAKKGESIKTILENDRFSYTNIDLAQRHVKHANNLASDELFKDQVIYLPFCSTSGLRRDIASYLSTAKVDPKGGP